MSFWCTLLAVRMFIPHSTALTSLLYASLFLVFTLLRITSHHFIFFFLQLVSKSQEKSHSEFLRMWPKSPSNVFEVPSFPSSSISFRILLVVFASCCLENLHCHSIFACGTTKIFLLSFTLQSPFKTFWLYSSYPLWKSPWRWHRAPDPHQLRFFSDGQFPNLLVLLKKEIASTTGL